jgi:site-specific DNA recombinase
VDNDWTGARVGLYTRLSQDRGATTSIERQDAEAREYVEGIGAAVVGTWSDPEASAYSERVHRPGFDALLAAATAGEIDAVCVWALDRLTRQPAQMERVIGLMRRSGLRLLSVKDGRIDLEAGALVPRFLTWRAEAESERISQRVKSANRKAAREGRAHSGGPRPWGHERGCRELREDEAALIREAAGRVIAGESMYGISMSWRERGVQTPTGTAWTGGNLCKMLAKPRIAGYRERDGELYRSDPTDGGIAPILDDATWRRLRAIIGDPSRRRPEVRTTRHLLSGVLWCGGCGHRMVCGMSHGRRVYKCQPANHPGACGLVSIAADSAEQVVAGAWIEAFNGPDSIAAVASRNGHHEAGEVELSELRERLASATRAHFVEGVLPRDGYMDAKRELEGRIADIERGQRRDDDAAQTAGLIGRSAAVWDAASLSERRALLRLVVAEVRIERRGKTGRFDPSRVAITWRA